MYSYTHYCVVQISYLLTILDDKTKIPKEKTHYFYSIGFEQQQTDGIKITGLLKAEMRVAEQKISTIP